MTVADPFRTIATPIRMFLRLQIAARQALTVFTLISLLSVHAAACAQDLQAAKDGAIRIVLANELETEATMANELRRLIRTYDVEHWILTREILIDHDQIPHSHPILTIHTRHIGAELPLLSTFVHEQLHWLEDEPWLEDFRAAMRVFEELFPIVPTREEGGARDQQSTYRHLLICDMELQALTTLAGQIAARETLAAMTHYEWIYDTVLNDPRIREVSLRHGFNTSAGMPNR